MFEAVCEALGSKTLAVEVAAALDEDTLREVLEYICRCHEVDVEIE